MMMAIAPKVLDLLAAHAILICISKADDYPWTMDFELYSFAVLSIGVQTCPVQVASAG
jgi:hypothetical protein